jgi:hypothetical protein
MPSRRKPGKPYAAKLREPIKVRLAESKYAPAGATLQKLGALCEHYEIQNDDPDKWFWLAMRLAWDHVPGFRLEAEKPKWVPTPKTTEDLILYVVLAEADMDHRSVKNAARLLSNRPGRFKGRSAEGLRQRYLRLKNPRTAEAQRMHALVAMLNRRKV